MADGGKSFRGGTQEMISIMGDDSGDISKLLLPERNCDDEKGLNLKFI